MADTPTLPQQDSGIRARRRARRLRRARGTYQWATNNPNLTGVPLSAKVPLAERPTLKWFATVGRVALQALRNQRAAERVMKRESSTMLESAEADEADLDRLEALLGDYEAGAPEAAASNAEDDDSDENDENDDAPEPSPTADYAGHGLLQLAEMALTPHPMVADVASALDQILAPKLEASMLASSAVELGDYDRLFQHIPLPAIQRSFLDDQTFAWMRVAGPNSVLLRGISKLPSNFPVTEAHYHAAVGTDDTLEAALTEGRAYLLDYAELATIEPGLWQGRQKYLSAPLALFAVPKGSTMLQAVAIQCGQDPGAHPIFNRTIAQDQTWGWRMAKAVVQIADGNYHELFVHLARTHLVVEAIAVAAHRQLSDWHPLFVLLRPHLEGTLSINARAAGDLIAEGGPIDMIFAGEIGSTQAAAIRDRLSFDFRASMPKLGFAERNVEGRFEYPYRDDATRVWDAIHGWVAQYVRVYYPTEADVAADTELAAWIAELGDAGQVRNLGPIGDREQLTEALTMMIFTASAQHAAVNFPQSSLMSYAPFISGSTWAPDPTTQAGKREPDWLAQLPPLSLALQQLTTLFTLGEVYYSTLWDSSFGYAQKFDDPRLGDALGTFHRALLEVETQIDRANEERPAKYEFLKPSLIPMSINI